MPHPFALLPGPHYSRFSAWKGRRCTFTVAILTLFVMVPATQVISTPNDAFLSYSLANGANSAPITPVANQALLVMGTQTIAFDQCVGQVAMLHFVGATNFLVWTGLESLPSTITASAAKAPGTHIVFLDNNHQVGIQVHTGDTFVVHNGAVQTRAGNVTLIW